jgi:acyl carrier protein
MTAIDSQLTQCFATVFPGLKPEAITATTQQNNPAWDSVAAITLLAVIEEEFHIQIDLEQLASLDSYAKIRDWLIAQA